MDDVHRQVDDLCSKGVHRSTLMKTRFKRKRLFVGVGGFLVSLVLVLTLLLPAIDPRYGLFPVEQKRDLLPVLGSPEWAGVSGSDLSSHCGEEGGYELSNALDGTGYWYHHAEETHWFILDMIHAYSVTNLRGRSATDGDPTEVNVYVSNSTDSWSDAVASAISTWQDTTDWVEYDCTDSYGRYIKVEITACEDSRNFAWGCEDPFITLFDFYGEAIIFDMNVNPSPGHTSHNNIITPKLAMTVNSPYGFDMNVTFRTNVTGVWGTIGTNSSVGNGTYRWTNASMSKYFTRYWWSVNTSDGMGNYDNDTYWFKTVRIHSSVTTISPYEQSSSPLTISATAAPGLSNVSLYYRYSASNDSKTYLTSVSEEDIVTGGSLNYPNAVAVSKGYAFVANYLNDSLDCYDVSNQTSMVLLQSKQESPYLDNPHAVVVTNTSNYCYVLTTAYIPNITVYNTTLKDNMVYGNSTALPITAPAEIGYYMTISDDDNFLYVTTKSYFFIYNITNKASYQLTLVNKTRVHTSSHIAWLPAVYGNTLYVPSGNDTALAPNNGLHVYNITNKNAPVFVNTLNNSTLCSASCQVLHHSNGFFYLFYSGRTRLNTSTLNAICQIAVYNISAGNATHPSYMYCVNISATQGTNGTSGWGVFKNDYLYLNTNNWKDISSPDWQNGFFVYNFTDIDAGVYKTRLYGKGSPAYLDYTHYFSEDRYEANDTTVYTVTQDDDSLISISTVWDDGWVLVSVDTSSPWSWSFTFPNGTGYYEFCTVGKKAGSAVEVTPSVKDAMCYYSVPAGTAWQTVQTITSASLLNNTKFQTKQLISTGSVLNSTKFQVKQTVSDPVVNATKFQTKQSISGSTVNSTVFRTLQTISGSERNLTSWMTIQIISSGSVLNLSKLRTVMTISGSGANLTKYVTVQIVDGSGVNVTSFRTLQVLSSGSLLNLSKFRTILSISGSGVNLTWFRTLQSVDGSGLNITRWMTQQTITGTIQNVSSWKTLLTVTGTIQNVTRWLTLQSINGTIQNISTEKWYTIQTITGEIKNLSTEQWYTIQTVTGTTQNTTLWMTQQTVTGTIQNVSAWKTLLTVTGTIQNMTSWRTRQTITGTIQNISTGEWVTIQTVTGEFKNLSGWVTVLSVNGSLRNTSTADSITISVMTPNNITVPLNTIVLRGTVSHSNGSTMNLSWYWNNSGVWTQIGTNLTGMVNGTYGAYATVFIFTSYSYQWRLSVSDGMQTVNRTVNFSTGAFASPGVSVGGGRASPILGLMGLFGLAGLAIILVYRRRQE